MKTIIYEDENTILYRDKEQQRGVATKLALFNSWVIEYSHKWSVSKKSNCPTIWGDTCYNRPNKKTNLKTKEDVETFCKENNIELIGVKFLDHPLAHGLPDCRSIKPY